MLFFSYLVETKPLSITQKALHCLAPHSPTAQALNSSPRCTLFSASVFFVPRELIRFQSKHHPFPKHILRLPRWLSGEESACKCRSFRRRGFDPWVGKIPWSRNGNPLQCSCLENSSGRGSWGATVLGVVKRQT